MSLRLVIRGVGSHWNHYLESFHYNMVSDLGRFYYTLRPFDGGIDLREHYLPMFGHLASKLLLLPMYISVEYFSRTFRRKDRKHLSYTTGTFFVFMYITHLSSKCLHAPLLSVSICRIRHSSSTAICC